MKRLVLAGGIVVIVAAIFAATTPWLLSSDIVKQRISARIEELTGLKTTLRGAPKLTLIPFLGIKLKDVVVANPPELAALYGEQPFVSMDALKGRLKLLPAMFGNPEIVDLKLVRPRFNLRTSREGIANWKTNSGALASIFSFAAQQSDDSSGAIQQSRPKTFKLGNYEIVNGAVAYQNDQLGKTLDITSINMNLSWPTSDAAVTVSGSMVWLGEVVRFSGNIDSPMDLISGKNSNMAASINSEPIKTDISGSIVLTSSSQFTGKIEASSPSVRQLLRWVGYDLAPGSTPGELALSADVSAIGTKFKFQNAKISLDGNAGTGFLDMTIAQHKPIKLGGTLAFDTLNFNPYFDALDANIGTDNTDSQIAKIDLINEFDLDLRFSAKTGNLGELTLSSIAATAQVNDGNVIIDIGEASLFGGMVQAQIQAKEEIGEPAGEMKLNLIDIDLEELGQFISPVGIKIVGKGSATILLKSTGRNASQLIQRLNGTTTIIAKEGRIVGLDLARIAKDGSSAIVLDTNEVLSKGTNFTNLKIGLHIANGIALFENTLVEGERIRATIDGKADLWRKSLALNGRVLLFKVGGNSDDKNRPVDLDIPFFVGGTLGAPLFAPDLLSPKRELPAEPLAKFSFQGERPKTQTKINTLN